MRLPVDTRRDDLRTQCRLHLHDFSLGGLRAESPVPLRKNERLTLSLPAGLGNSQPLQLTGRVVHCRRTDDRFQIGIELCGSEKEAAASPYRLLPRLFCLAATYATDA